MKLKKTLLSSLFMAALLGNSVVATAASGSFSDGSLVNFISTPTSLKNFNIATPLTSTFNGGVDIFFTQPVLSFTYNFGFTLGSGFALNATTPVSVSPTVLGSFDKSGNPVDIYKTVITSSTLTGGPVYNLQVIGAASGVNSPDHFDFSINVSPVPEPEQWAMMLVGLTLVSIQSIKSRKSATRLGAAV